MSSSGRRWPHRGTPPADRSLGVTRSSPASHGRIEGKAVETGRGRLGVPFFVTLVRYQAALAFDFAASGSRSGVTFGRSFRWSMSTQRITEILPLKSSASAVHDSTQSPQL